MAVPEAVFILTSHRPLKIDAPGRSIRIEIDGTKWNFHLSRPTGRCTAHARHPDPVPRTIDADAEVVAEPGISPWVHQSVTHRAGGVDLEEVPRPPVEKRVDRPHESIIGLERPVALHLVGKDSIRFAVVTDHAEQQPVRVVQNPDFSTLGCRRTVVRIALQEVGSRLHAFPRRLIGYAVESDDIGLAHSNRSDGTRGLGRIRLRDQEVWAQERREADRHHENGNERTHGWLSVVHRALSVDEGTAWQFARKVPIQ